MDEYERTANRIVEEWCGVQVGGVVERESFLENIATLLANEDLAILEEILNMAARWQSQQDAIKRVFRLDPDDVTRRLLTGNWTTEEGLTRRMLSDLVEEE